MTDQAERTVKNDVLIPMMQSFFIGCFAGFATAAGAAIKEAGALFAWWVIGASVGGMISYAAKTSSFTMPRVDTERVFARDEQLLKVQVDNFDSPQPFKKAKIGTIPCKKKLPELARLILVMGRSFSYADLEGKGNLYKRKEFEQVRAAMIALGLLYWINPENHREGVGWTVGGIAFLRRVQRGVHTSPPLRTRFSPGVGIVE